MKKRLNEWKIFYQGKYPKIWEKRLIYYGFMEYHKGILRLLNGQEGEKILECKIGTGWPLAISLAREGTSITGIDISRGLLKRCQENFREVIY